MTTTFFLTVLFQSRELPWYPRFLRLFHLMANNFWMIFPCHRWNDLLCSHFQHSRARLKWLHQGMDYCTRFIDYWLLLFCAYQQDVIQSISSLYLSPLLLICSIVLRGDNGLHLIYKKDCIIYATRYFNYRIAYWIVRQVSQYDILVWNYGSTMTPRVWFLQLL